MASLKEIKERIQSVRSTRKTTSAMKMVAAAKLHRAQRDMGALVPYSEELQGIVGHLAGGEGVGEIALATEREPQRVTVVGFASNSTLCGAYNANVAKEVRRVLGDYAKQEGVEVEMVTMGRRLSVELTREKVSHTEGNNELSEHPDYASFKAMAEGLMERFLAGQTDRVELVYYKFLSAGVQRLVCERLLPVVLPTGEEEPMGAVPYILEPSRRELVESIVPRQVALKLYTAALSALASEHAARMMAMQVATDNADELIKELSVEYNKQRQQAITTELLDIVGGQNR